MHEKITAADSVEEAAGILTSAPHGRNNIDDSFWIFDLGEVATNLQIWRKLMPRVKPFYAVKAAPHQSLVKYLILEGTGLDCASQYEVDAALKNGACPSDIILANAIKQVSHLEHAKKRKINLTVFDCKEELHKIKKHHPESEVLLRIETHCSDVIDNLSRFGANFEESERLIKLSKELNMKLVGICFHVGSGCHDVSAYARALKDSRKLFDFAKTLGFHFKVLDIGGGFPGMREAVPPFQEFAHLVNENLTTLFPKDEFPLLRIIAEPGKYFSTGAFTLVTHVIGKRESNAVNGKVTYTINDGLYGNLTELALGQTSDGEAEPVLLGNSMNRESRVCKICGPTCSGVDVILGEKLLPELEIGDWLLWKNCGSYTFSLASDFNGFKQGLFYTILSGDSKKLLNDDKLHDVMNGDLSAM